MTVRDPVRIGVVLCVAAALVAALVEFPGTLDRLDRRASSNSALDFLDREIAGGNSLEVSQSALYYARGLIPRQEAYRVVTGPNLQEQTELTLPFIEAYLTYFLMPRRTSNSARWIICYGCDRDEWGDRLEVLRDEGNGVAIGRLRS